MLQGTGIALLGVEALAVVLATATAGVSCTVYGAFIVKESFTGNNELRNAMGAKLYGVIGFVSTYVATVWTNEAFSPVTNTLSRPVPKTKLYRSVSNAET